jgi:hypothetical protein
MLVIFDDLDLPIGRLRLRPFGGTGGHKGMSSIIKALGSNRFARLRIGISRPPGKMDHAAYVLQDFSPQQEEEMSEVRHRAVEAVELWLSQQIDAVMNEVNPPATGAPVKAASQAKPDRESPTSSLGSSNSENSVADHCAQESPAPPPEDHQNP